MDSKKYKEFSEYSNIFKREDLEEIYYLIKGSLHNEASGLYQILLDPPIPKPYEAIIGDQNDLLAVFMNEEIISNIHQKLFSSEADAVSPEGNTAPSASSIGYLADRWGELMDLNDDEYMISRESVNEIITLEYSPEYIEKYREVIHKSDEIGSVHQTF